MLGESPDESWLVTPKEAPSRKLRLTQWWVGLGATCALSLLGVAVCGLASPADAAETYTSDLVVREETVKPAQTEPGSSHIRVDVPDTLTVQEVRLSPAQAGRRARLDGGQPGESQTVTWVAVFIFSTVLCLSRLSPEVRETYFHPWSLLPGALRRRLQLACAPQDASAAGGRRLVRAMEQGAAPGFLEPEPEPLEVLRGLINAVQEAQDPLKRQELLLRAYLLTHALTAIREPRRQRAAWQIRHSLEGLLKSLMNRAVPSTATAFLTAARTVEVLQELLAAGPQSEALFEWPIRILAVYDDPVTCRAMTDVLESVFQNARFAEDGESAVALAAERAFDVIFIDVELQGIDGYAVCGMLRQIAMHHYTPVVLVTERADASARAEAKAWGADELISKPLLAVEVTLQALILAMRYRLAGGGATPRNAAEACANRLWAQGQVPEESGIVCGTDDTQILRVVTRN